jgi:serine/threonine-protein kinase
MSLVPGTPLGSFEVLGLIGAGGMGEVYRARDKKLNRDVALKVLPPLVAGDPDRLARFRREAQVLASLNDPHIAQIYGFEDADGTHALVMELVEGPTLAERLEPGPLPVADALAIARQIASALDAAHEHGIVHRDLKPSNVKVREDGSVKVLDFGLAKALAPPGEPSPDAANSPTMTAHATELGMILGTAAYMAPEQARGRSVDKRADIRAFGVVLFEMLTGRPLFSGETVSDTLAAVLRQEIDWTTLPADIPPNVRRLLQRCLERDRRHRLRDIGDAAIELDATGEAAARVDTVAAARFGWRSRGFAWTIAALAIVAAIAVAAWAWRRPAPAPGQILRSREVVEGTNAFMAMSRDGTEIVYARATPDGPAIMLRRMDALDAAPVPGAAGFPEAFSPDGQVFVYADATRRSLRRIPVGGGMSALLCDGCVSGGPAAWGDDGTIVFGGTAGLSRVAASGGTPVALTTVDATHGEVAHLEPQWLPGGRALLFTVITGSGAALAVFDPATGGKRIIATTGVSNRYVPGGYVTYVRDRTLFAAPFDARRLTITGAEVPVVQDILVHQTPLGALADYAVSGAGLLTYETTGAGGGGTTLAWSDRSGVTHALPGPSEQPAWGTGDLSPDGRFVVNSLGRDGQQNIWVLDTSRGTLARLSFEGIDFNPIWTPDGRAAVYWSTRTPPARSGLYRVAGDGSARPTLVLATDIRSIPTSISPDGRWLLVDRADESSASPGRIFLVALRPDGSADGDPRPLHDTVSAESNGAISPDGRWVAYVSAETGQRAVYVQPFPGPGPRVRVSTAAGFAPRWAPDGGELYYLGGSGPTVGVVAVAIPAGALMRPDVPAALFKKPLGTTWDATPDRNRFLVELAGGMASKTTFVTVTNWTDELRRAIAAAP